LFTKKDFLTKIVYDLTLFNHKVTVNSPKTQKTQQKSTANNIATSMQENKKNISIYL